MSLQGAHKAGEAAKGPIPHPDLAWKAAPAPCPADLKHPFGILKVPTQWSLLLPHNLTFQYPACSGPGN